MSETPVVHPPPSFAVAPGRRIAEFEGLRGVLALWVFIAHTLSTSNYTLSDLPRGVSLLLRPSMAVDVFFILSGFVILKLLHDAKETYGRFLVRRFFRIYPVYVICLAAAIALGPIYLAGLEFNSANHLYETELTGWRLAHEHFWGNLAAHLFLVHGVVPESVLPHGVGSLLGPAWSIAVEWQFYLVAPLLAYLLYRSRKSWFLISIVIFAMMFVAAPFWLKYYRYAFLPQKLVFFWIGMVSYEFRETVEKQNDKLADLLLAIGIPFLLFMVPWEYAIPLGIWFCVFSASFSASATGLPGLIFWSLSGRVIQWLGRVSYCFYMVHAPCMWIALWLISLGHQSLSRGPFAAILVPLALVLTCAASDLLHRFVEVPGMRLGRRLSQPRT